MTMRFAEGINSTRNMIKARSRGFRSKQCTINAIYFQIEGEYLNPYPACSTCMT